MACLVSGVGIMFGFVPFRTCPLLAQMFACPLSFFVCLVWLSTTFSLFLSLSGAGETQTPVGVWVSPSVSSSWTRTSSSTRTPCSSRSPRSSPAPVFFFFFSTALAWVFFGCGSRCLGCLSVCLVCLSVCLSVCLPVHVCIACKTSNPPLLWREGDNHLPPPGHYHCHFLGIGVRTEVPCIPCTDSVSPPPPPPSCRSCKGQPRKGVGEDRARQPYCHTLWGLIFLLPQGGNAVRFFHFVFFSVRSGVFCRFLSFFSSKGRFWKNFRERTFVFGWLCWSCVFW